MAVNIDLNLISNMSYDLLILFIDYTYKKYGKILGFTLQYASLLWSRYIKEVACNACLFCGSTSQLHAHHIKTQNKYPLLKYNPHNGMCLCKKCHNRLHTKYRRMGM